MDTFKPILDATGSVGVVGRNAPVRVLNISRSGCLLESSDVIPEGSVGRLGLAFQGETYVDDVVVRRCRKLEGAGGLFHVGVEFLWTSPPAKRSLRMIAWFLQTLDTNRSNG